MAVEPVVLEGALASILQRLDLDDVVTRDEGAPSGSFDAAIVTITLPSDAQPDVVITLSDTVGFGSPGRLVAAGRSEEVEVADAAAIIDLLDATVPATSSRAERLQHLFHDPR